MEFGKYKELWRKLMSTKRFAESETDEAVVLRESQRQEGRHPFEADIGRVVFSQPFRRLAGKTQVHPFASIDYIHNRLTHSIETAYISRALGRKFAAFLLKNRGDVESEDVINEIGWVCEAAGLMHDMGNPPYGHAGEDAIRAWADKNAERIKECCGSVGEAVVKDFRYFDGNAQAFRMASRPGLRETCYFKLTCATLGALVKYPYETGSSDGMKGKSAAFSTEEDIFNKLTTELGLKKKQRHPLSYITEAADDICYRINDFEDAVLMGLMDEREVRALLMDGMSFDVRCELRTASLSRIKARSIGFLIDEFLAVAERNYDAIMEGAFSGDLKSKIDNRWGGVLARIKEKYSYIFSERKKVISEIGSYGQIGAVLDKFLLLFDEIKPVSDASERKRPGYEGLTFLSQRLITLAWGGKTYYEQNTSRDMSWWLHAALDYVVGMTDDYLHRIADEIK